MIDEEHVNPFTTGMAASGWAYWPPDRREPLGVKLEATLCGTGALGGFSARNDLQWNVIVMSGGLGGGDELAFEDWDTMVRVDSAVGR